MGWRPQGADHYRAAMRANGPSRVDERSWRVLELVLGAVALLAAFALNGR